MSSLALLFPRSFCIFWKAISPLILHTKSQNTTNIIFTSLCWQSVRVQRDAFSEQTRMLMRKKVNYDVSKDVSILKWSYRFVLSLSWHLNKNGKWMVWGLKWSIKQYKKQVSRGFNAADYNSQLSYACVTSLNDYICTLLNVSFQVNTRLIFGLLPTLETSFLSTQPKNLTKAHANINKVLTTGTALPLLPSQRSESQHWKEHVPLACWQLFNFALASSHSAWLAQTLVKALDSTFKTLNSKEIVAQRSNPEGQVISVFLLLQSSRLTVLTQL